MKKIIAIAAIIASTSASAFWTDNGYYGADNNANGTGSMTGNGDAVGEASFSMSFTGKGRTNGGFVGNGDLAGRNYWNGQSYQQPYYYMPYAPAAPTAE